MRMKKQFVNLTERGVGDGAWCNVLLLSVLWFRCGLEKVMLHPNFGFRDVSPVVLVAKQRC